MADLTASFRLETDDYYYAWLAKQRKDRLIRIGATVGFCLLLNLMLLIGTGKEANKLVAIASADAFVLTVLFTTELYSRRKMRTSAQKLAQACEGKTLNVTFSAEGLDDGNGNKERWEKFSGYTESNNSFVLYQSGTIHAIVPKRSLKVETVDALRQMMKRSLTSV